jgi:hypothetical protein
VRAQIGFQETNQGAIGRFSNPGDEWHRKSGRAVQNLREFPAMFLDGNIRPQTMAQARQFVAIRRSSNSDADF